MKATDKDYSSLGWAAWANKMPGSKPSLHVKGSVLAPTPCHEPKLVPNPDVIVAPEVLPLKLEFTVTGDVCLQVITPKEVSYTKRPFAGGKDSVLVLLPDGVSISMPIEDVH